MWRYRYNSWWKFYLSTLEYHWTLYSRTFPYSNDSKKMGIVLGRCIDIIICNGFTFMGLDETDAWFTFVGRWNRLWDSRYIFLYRLACFLLQSNWYLSSLERFLAYYWSTNIDVNILEYSLKGGNCDSSNYKTGKIEAVKELSLFKQGYIITDISITNPFWIVLQI